jgi:hypothetical protein
MSDKPKPPFDPAAKKALAEERATEGAKAMTEYKAAVEAEHAKTERLKALRLAKEAAGDVAKQPKDRALSPDDPLAKKRSKLSRSTNQGATDGQENEAWQKAGSGTRRW